MTKKMKPEATIARLETLLPENYSKKHPFPPGWGGGFSTKQDVSAEVSEILGQSFSKFHSSEQSATTEELSKHWLEAVWNEEVLHRSKWEKWVLECAKNPDNLNSRVKQLKEDREAKRREEEKREEERRKRKEEEAEQKRREERETEARRAAQRRAREKREAERQRLAEEEEEKKRLEEQEAEARRQKRRQERAKRKAEEAAQFAEEVADIKIAMRNRKAEKERIKDERRQKEREGAEAAYQEKIQELRKWNNEKWRLGWTWFSGIALVAMPLFVFFIRRHGFDVALARTKVVWPWCWWHLKFGVGVELLAIGGLAMVFAIVSEDDDKIVAGQRFENDVNPLIERFFMISVYVVIVMLICAIWHTFGTLGFAFRSFGVSLLLIGECLVHAMVASAAYFLFNGVLWHRYISL